MCQVPQLSVAGPLRVSYGGSVTLTTDQLTISDLDTPADQLILTLEQQPRHGNVTNDGRLMVDGDQFSVEQLARHRIRSLQRHSSYRT